MIAVEEHLAAVLAGVGPLPATEVALADALGLTLAADVAALLAVPPFTNSAMDGFAVRADDVALPPVTLRVAGESAAGPGDLPAVGPGQAVRVMTGGRLPPGADAVVPVELTDQPRGAAPLPDAVRIDQTVPPGRHVRRAGEDVAAGDPVLTAGTVLSAAALAALAAVGHGVVRVHRRPRVAVLATGAELVAAGEAPAPGQIPDSNSLMLAALARAWGAEVTVAGRVGDDPGAFEAALAAVAAGADAVLTTGGVSVGAYDVVRQARGELVFAEVAMQPGKPQGRGWVTTPDGRRVPVLAFPGNPVSGFVSFQVFARPLLARLAGRTEPARTRAFVAAAGWTSVPGRRQYLPVALTDDGTCRPSHALGSGSHLIASLHLADGLAIVGEDVTAVTAGQTVQVMEL